jgi:hypothetical protein
LRKEGIKSQLISRTRKAMTREQVMNVINHRTKTQGRVVAVKMKRRTKAKQGCGSTIKKALKLGLQRTGKVKTETENFKQRLSLAHRGVPP